MAKCQLCSIEGCCNTGQMRRGLCNNHYKRLRKYGDPLAGGVSRGVPLKWVFDHAGYKGEECLKWPFGCRGDGRGSVKMNGVDRRVQALMCELAHGPAPTKKHQSAHSCGKGSLGCVNPRHLRWATPVENMADKIIHDTHMRGRRTWSCKLTEADVLEIRASRGRKTYMQLSEKFGVSMPAIGDIYAGRSWAWLSGG